MYRRTIILRTQATDQGVQVAVRDFGTGIDPSRLDDIWEPFFTTKKAGLGMGLSICRSIIRAHEGRIWAENNPDGEPRLPLKYQRSVMSRHWSAIFSRLTLI